MWKEGMWGDNEGGERMFDKTEIEQILMGKEQKEFTYLFKKKKLLKH